MNGLYIHVPFCVKKCGYCDFYSMTDQGAMDDYVKALVREIKQISETEPPDNKTADTVYFGGGTPSLLSLAHLETILQTVRDSYSLTPDVELTLEMNPGTVSVQKLKDLKTLGVNRLSIGVQSFQDAHLRFLDRIHTAREAETVLDSARNEGFDNVGIDLIYGLPGQDKKNLEMDLEKATRFSPAHLSCYTLSYEEGTPLFKSKEQKRFRPLSDDRMAGLFTHTMDYLEHSGYLHYEISNFASRPGTRSRHNKKYWDFLPYRGFGPSAHSYLPWEKKRYWNVRDLETYITRLTQGGSPEEDHEILSKSQQITEAIYLGLRKREGIVIRMFNEQFKADFFNDFNNTLSTLIKQRLIHISKDSICLSRKGILFADHIAARFVESI